MSFSESQRKSIKWYKTFFSHFLDILLYNAYVLYKLQIGGKFALFTFRLNVVLALLKRFGIQTSDGCGRSFIGTSVHVTAQRFPSKVKKLGK